MSAMRGFVWLALLAGGLIPLPAAAQYFGQNKVQYRTFDFKIIQTEHFEVYYYDRERAAALDAARLAERSYARLSRVLHHQFQGRKAIILYASASEFQQTNVVSEDLSEAVGGETEFFKHRMVLPFTGAYSDLEEVIQHEMVHQFQFDVFSRGRIGGGMQTLVTVNPPGWFMEGMAAYFSRPALDPETAMWLRDASLEGHLPTIQQLTYDPRIFPYRFGQALWAYIGEKWGDEAIGEILQASVTAGVEGAFKRALGLTLDQLSDEWRDAVQTTFLPQLGEHYRARRISQPLLTEKRSQGTLHVAPAFTPDGREIAYFSEKNNFFIDLYLADAETGRVKRRLVKSTLSSNYESLRFITSAGSFSPDGRYFALAVKHQDRDDLVILDVKRDREVRRILVPLNGLTTPAWSPDGRQLVFTGYDGGLSDLFLINADGTGLRRLTNDKYADLQPTWSPDGKTIAFATDRGPQTNFSTLQIGNLRLALYHLESGVIETLGHMTQGKNINPEWAPDGQSLAFVSDRTGINNIYLYDFTDGNVYQLTDLYTGAAGIMQLSPVLSWARQADRLAFVYYEDGNFNVYAVDNPRSLKRRPLPDGPTPPMVSLLAARRDTTRAGEATAVSATGGATPPVQGAQDATSVYRGPRGFRPSAAPGAAEPAGGPVSVRDLVDSTTALPDTSEFTFKPYKVRFSADYVARPTIGYQRDNFGRGFFGGTAISLSDMLGNHTLIFSGAVNGRLSEAQVLAAYINQSHRLNWLTGFSQQPLYFYAPSTASTQFIGPNPGDSAIVLTTNLERLVIRDVFGEAYYPFNRFNRIEFALHAVSIGSSILELSDYYYQSGQYSGYSTFNTISGATIGYAQPSVALVHDNALFGYVGPFSGGRSRVEIAPTFGSWRFTAGSVDYRRYLFARPFTLAMRGLFFGRAGRDADLFPIFLGSTELIRGYTASSFRTNECVTPVTVTSRTGCAELDQLIGSRVAVANIELRFPLTRSLVLGFLPIGFPPIEGALFYDVGLAWNTLCPGNGRTECSVVRLTRPSSANPDRVRAPLKSYGGSIRVNLLGFVILRLDLTKPMDRPNKHAYWTVSLGPTF
jgi:Tol biopolymer transport system component